MPQDARAQPDATPATFRNTISAPILKTKKEVAG